MVYFGFFSADSERLKTLKNLAVKRGGSLSIPCSYDEKYKSNIKYWCKGRYWSSCEIVASTNTSGRTSVTDHPTQNMFTVELNSLHKSLVSLVTVSFHNTLYTPKLRALAEGPNIWGLIRECLGPVLLLAVIG